MPWVDSLRQFQEAAGASSETDELGNAVASPSRCFAMLAALALLVLLSCLHSTWALTGGTSIQVAGLDPERPSISASSFSNPASLSQRACHSDGDPDAPPLKVYVYELDPKFHFGLSSASARNTSTSPPAFPYSRKRDGTLSGTGFEHSAEAFITYDLLYPPQVHFLLLLRILLLPERAVNTGRSSRSFSKKDPGPWLLNALAESTAESMPP